MEKPNIFACYRNIEGKWVVDGNNGRDTYPGNWDKKDCMNAYSDHCDGYKISLGKYEIYVYSHDIKYNDGFAALVTVNKFNEDTPLGQKSFYLPNGKYFNQWVTEEQIDAIFEKKEGSWL